MFKLRDKPITAEITLYLGPCMVETFVEYEVAGEPSTVGRDSLLINHVGGRPERRCMVTAERAGGGTDTVRITGPLADAICDRLEEEPIRPLLEAVCLQDWWDG